MRIDHILFPTDFSDQSFAAMSHASELAATFGAMLHILYVDDLSDLVAKSPYCCPSFVAAVDRSEVKARLEKIKPTVSTVRYKHHFVEGDPATRICAVADSEGCDLIVMSSHGRTGIPRLVMGSITEEVLRYAKCPVLVVKPSGRTSVAEKQPAATASG